MYVSIKSQCKMYGCINHDKNGPNSFYMNVKELNTTV